MDVEIRLRTLEFRYGAVWSAAAAAKAKYLALAEEPSATAFATERAKLRWRLLDALKRTIAAQMGEHEEFEPDATH